MVPPRTGARKHVVSDASNLGYGAELLQFEEVAGQEGEWRPVAFIARKLTGGEPRYTTPEKEAGSFVFAIRKWRHLLEVKTFQVVTDHLALKWLMNLRLPHFRLAKWIVEVQKMDFEVFHAAGDGELMAIPDATSRDFVDGLVLCHRCLEVVAEIDEDAAEKMSHEDAAATMRHEQKAEFRHLQTFARKNGYFLSDEGLVSRLHQSQVQMVVPKPIVQKVLGSVHGARTAGHWGVSRTTLAVARRYWWPEWLAGIEEQVGKCLPCATTRLGRSGHRNARLVRYTPSRRFELVALDVTEISPMGGKGEKKVVVVGDVVVD
jgi:RNase H-like domain found in reverse transcriptase/Integrase zinc binding domain